MLLREAERDSSIRATHARIAPAADALAAPADPDMRGGALAISATSQGPLVKHLATRATRLRRLSAQKHRALNYKIEKCMPTL